MFFQTVYSRFFVNVSFDEILTTYRKTRKQSPAYIALFIFFCAIYPGDYVQQVTTFWRRFFDDYYAYGILINFQFIFLY